MKLRQLYVLFNLGGFQGVGFDSCRVKKTAEAKLTRREYKVGVSVNKKIYNAIVKCQQLGVLLLIIFETLMHSLIFNHISRFISVVFRGIP